MSRPRRGKRGVGVLLVVAVPVALFSLCASVIGFWSACLAFVIAATLVALLIFGLELLDG